MKLIFAVCFCLATAALAGATTVISIDPSPTQVYVGEAFSLNVDISTDAEIAGFQFDVLFPTFLNVTGITEEGYFAANGCCFSFDTPDNVNGDVTNVLDVIAGPADLTGNDTLVSIQFQAVGTGVGEVTLDPSTLILSDDDFNQIPVDTLNSADVTASAAPEPSSLTLAGAAALLLAWRRVRGASR
jgi:PEP-CTERM motif